MTSWVEEDFLISSCPESPFLNCLPKWRTLTTHGWWVRWSNKSKCLQQFSLYFESYVMLQGEKTPKMKDQVEEGNTHYSKQYSNCCFMHKVTFLYPFLLIPENHPPVISHFPISEKNAVKFTWRIISLEVCTGSSQWYIITNWES